jgi:hypothetical protein
MSETAIGSADLVDSAPDQLRERYEARMAERRRAWRDAWSREDLPSLHPEDGLVEAHRTAWHDAFSWARGVNAAWDPTPLEEALVEAVLLSAQLGLWSRQMDGVGEVSWGDVHLALYRQARIAHVTPPELDEPPLTALALVLHRSLLVSLPKTLDRVVRRAQEAAESLGMVIKS